MQEHRRRTRRLRCEQSCFLLFYFPLVAKGSKKELRCSLECKYLNSDDYKDLLWTTLSEFPGTHQTFPHKGSQHTQISTNFGDVPEGVSYL